MRPRRGSGVSSDRGVKQLDTDHNHIPRAISLPKIAERNIQRGQRARHPVIFAFGGGDWRKITTKDPALASPATQWKGEAGQMKWCIQLMKFCYAKKESIESTSP